MFSGIVEETGQVIRFEEMPEAWKLTVSAGAVLEGLAAGDSMSVNGCCLTVVEHGGKSMTFDLLGETVRLTTFQYLKPGVDKVNLERSLRFGGGMGGHFVSGHVDAVGTVALMERRGKDFYMRVEPPPRFMRYVVFKGSIAVDGVSLTVAEADETGLGIWLIPHTIEVTNFHQRHPGDPVNLEFDLLAKYTEKLLAGRRGIREQMGKNP